MPKQTEAPAIRISTNTIIGNKFYTAYAPLPFARVEDLPENLRPLVVTGEAEEPEEPNRPRGAFELNTAYQVTSDGRLGRRVQRQIAQMEAEAEEEAWLEEEADRPLPPEIAESLQEAHQSHVGLVAAQAAADAERADQIADGVAADAAPPQLFVKRGSRHYISTDKARLKPGEPVFLKNADGSYEAFDICDSRGEAPDPPTIIT